MSAALFALVKARAKYSMTLTARQQLKCSMQLSLLLLTSSLQLAAVILRITAVILQHNMFRSTCCIKG